MGQIQRNVIVGLVAALALVGVFISGWNPSSTEARERLEVELREFPAFSEHQTLLLGIVEENHDRVFKANVVKRRRHRALAWESYRAQMYIELVNGLEQAGHSKVAIQLDRFRADESR